MGCRRWPRRSVHPAMDRAPSTPAPSTAQLRSPTIRAGASPRLRGQDTARVNKGALSAATVR
eukprot:507031-Lingulodinium_polyedra.AAC.1